MIELIISVSIGIYASLIFYLFERLRRLRKLPKEERMKMSFTQRLLYLYGSSQLVKRDLPSTADTALSTFRDSWKEMEIIFKQLERAFENRKKELQDAEQSFTDLQQSIKEQDDRLRALSQLTPEAAAAVSEAITMGSRTSLRQQVIISVVFFVLGIVTTLGISILIR